VSIDISVTMDGWNGLGGLLDTVVCWRGGTPGTVYCVKAGRTQGILRECTLFWLLLCYSHRYRSFRVT
jgi:hypothetical protein